MATHHTKYLIIGAGPAGLGAGFRLRELGESDFLILDREHHCGGLAASFVDERGFTWDIGGHVQFSHYSYFDEALDLVVGKSEWYHHDRASFVWLADRFVPYPFQNNINGLPREIMWECLEGIIRTIQDEKRPSPTNFLEWIHASFGEGIARHFMVPYNTKVWAHPPQEMAYQWIGERVATVDLAKICRTILFEEADSTWGPNRTFRFPKHGGTGGIWEAVGSYLGVNHLRLGTEVLALDPEKKIVRCNEGTEFTYEHLLSTLPIPTLTARTQGVPASLIARANALKYSSTHVVGLGIEGTLSPLLEGKCWMYFPESHFPFYRMTIFSHYSPAHVPNPAIHYSLMCETSESESKPVDRTSLVQATEDCLRSVGLIQASDRVESKWLYSTPFGYPTPSIGRDQILKQVIPALEARGIFSRGRFGGWKYEVSNQDHTFMQGVEWVNYVVRGEMETTYRADSSEDPNITRLRK